MATLTAEEFVKCCGLFVEASNSLRDGWEKKVDRSDFPYLVKKFINKHKSFSLDQTVDNSDALEDYITIECHVIYSESYCNPVLYFTACKFNGQTLKLVDCWSMVDDSVKHLPDRWSFMTQVEHPILCKPYLQLHPCHTKDFMKYFAHNNCFYLLSWLSVVLPVIRLDFPSESYYKYFDNLKLS